MTLLLTREAYAAVGEHVTEDYPAEAVGLLVGPADGPVTQAHRLVNEERRSPGLGYQVGREALDAAYRRLAAAGHSVLGVYHSHCDRWARFSPVDRSGAAPGVLHVVVAVHGSTVDGSSMRGSTVWEIRAWMRHDYEPEHEVPIEVLP
jgi:proteasome lid subunit RPN8/RPN11